MTTQEILEEMARLEGMLRERDRAFHATLPPRWCIAARATPNLTARYNKVFTPKAFAKLRAEWEKVN